MKKCLIIALAAALAIAFAAPAFAAPTVKISARINQEFGWLNQSEELTSSGSDVTDLFMPLVGNSYLRAKFMSEDKKVGAHVELALKSSIALRHGFAWYKVGSCTFAAGQTDNWHGAAPGSWPYQKLSAAPAGGDFLGGWGKAWLPRNPKLQLTWMGGAVGFQVSLEQPRSAPVSFGSGTDQYETFPGITVSVNIKAGSVSLTPSVSYWNWQAEGTASGVDDSISAYGVILPIIFKAGKFKILAEIHYGVNVSTVWSGFGNAAPVSKSDGSFEDGTVVGGFVELSHGFGALTIAVGVGVNTYSNDAWTSDSGYTDDSFTRTAYYIAVPYKAHKYLTIRPEFGYYDHGDSPATGDDGGNEWVLGVLFRFII